MTLTAFRFLARYANPHTVRRLGHRRLSEFLHRSSRGAWAAERATAILAAAATSIALWGDEIDFDELAADIAAEARLALSLYDEIHILDRGTSKRCCYPRIRGCDAMCEHTRPVAR